MHSPSFGREADLGAVGSGVRGNNYVAKVSFKEQREQPWHDACHSVLDPEISYGGILGQAGLTARAARCDPINYRCWCRTQLNPRPPRIASIRQLIR